MNYHFSKIVVVGSFLLTVAATTFSQTSPPYDLSHNVIAGGGDRSTGSVGPTNFTLTGTVGQHAAGETSTSASPQFSVAGGFWMIANFAPTAAGVSFGGRVLTATGSPISNVRVSLSGPQGIRVAITNGFGYYRFDSIETGHIYLMEGTAKRYEFVPRTVMVVDEVTDFELVAIP